MTTSRPRRPRRIAPDISLEAMLELLAVFERMVAVNAFRRACHKQAWDTAHETGSRCCGAAEFEAAEAAVIASGHARPLREWDDSEAILDAWLRDTASEAAAAEASYAAARPKGSARSSR